MPQLELAKLVGVSRQTIYYLERGSYNPSLTVSFKISEFKFNIYRNDNTNIMIRRENTIDMLITNRVDTFDLLLNISVPHWPSIAYLITVEELTAEGFFIAAKTYKYIEIFVIIAVIYLVLTVLLTAIIDKIENKLSIPGIGVPKRIAQRNA